MEGVAEVPPIAPLDGQGWLIGPAPTGDWTGQAGRLAFRQAGNWIFIAPRDGMRVLDRSTGQERSFDGAWKAPAAPALPAGGQVVDAEARATLAALVAALREIGVFTRQ